MIKPLPPHYRALLLTALAPFADRIAQVELYDPDAENASPPKADIGLAVTGDIDHETMLAIEDALDRSDVTLQADVRLLTRFQGERFVDEIERSCKLLFTHDDLVAAEGH